jgi:transposase InsO family protein
VLSDNCSVYRYKPWRQACEALGKTAKRTRPSTPRTNGKEGRFIKTLVNEWGYGLSFQSSEERNRWSRRYLAIHNGRRCHMAFASRTPLQ